MAIEETKTDKASKCLLNEFLVNPSTRVMGRVMPMSEAVRLGSDENPPGR